MFEFVLDFFQSVSKKCFEHQARLFRIECVKMLCGLTLTESKSGESKIQND